MNSDPPDTLSSTTPVLPQSGRADEIARILRGADVVQDTLDAIEALPLVMCAAWIHSEDAADPIVDGVSPRLLPGAPLPPWLITASQDAPNPDARWHEIEPLPQAGRRLMRLALDSAVTSATIALLVDSEISLDTLADARLLALVGILHGRLANGSTDLGGAALRSTMQVIAAADQYDHPKAACRAICDAFAAQMKCDRASLGALRGGLARVISVSNAEKVTPSASQVRAIIDVLEECIGQGETLFSPSSGASPVIERAARDLCAIHGSSSQVLACPITVNRNELGAVVLERFAGPAFTDREQQGVQTACELLARRFADLVQRDQPAPARFVHGVRCNVAALLGPSHTWAKLTALLLAALLLVSVMVRGQDHAAASATIISSEIRSISSPFAGFISAGYVEVGDVVVVGETVIAVMDTAQLELELLQARAEEHANTTDAAHYREQMRTAEAAIASARADEVRARIHLLEHQITGATLLAPISGVVVEGNARQLAGASVGVGQQIVRVVDPDRVYVHLAIPEPEIRGVQPGSTGQIITPAFPSHPLDFEVMEVSSLVSEYNGTRVLTAKATITESPEWLVPGMDGKATIRTTRRPLLMVWTRRLTDWIRLKLWL